MKIPKRTYYYQIKNFDKKKDKDKEITKLIKEIFKKHRGKYGYLRITEKVNIFFTKWACGHFIRLFFDFSIV